MKARLREILGCPRCHGDLLDGDLELRCPRCSRAYPILNGVPVFIPPDELEIVTELPVRSGYDPWLHFMTMASLPQTALFLDIGAGDMGLDHPNIIRLDVFLSAHCDVVADAHSLPFKDDSFELVFSLAVLEHLRQPFIAAREMYRVIKSGGWVYCDTNFVFPYHGFPRHYYNFSIHGIEQVFESFEALRVCVPPYQMPSFAIEGLLTTYLAHFVPVTGQERQAVAAVRSLLSLPWREFDRHFPADQAYTCAAGVCFYGMKGTAPLCLPDVVLRIYGTRDDLKRKFPIPHDLSTNPNLVLWAARAGRNEHPELAALFDENPLVPWDSLRLPAPAMQDDRKLEFTISVGPQAHPRSSWCRRVLAKALRRLR